MLTQPSVVRTGALTTLLVGPTLSLAAAWAQESQDRPDRLLREELRVGRSSVQQIALPAGLPDEFTIALEHGRTTESLRLRRHSLRAPDFRVRVQREDGRLATREPPPSATYRGVVENHPSSAVAAGLQPSGLTAIVLMEGEPAWYVHPLADIDASAHPATHVAHWDIDVRSAPPGCESDALMLPGGVPAAASSSRSAPPAGRDGGCLETCQIAFDSDFAFYEHVGSSEAAVVSAIEEALNGVDLIFARDALITYELTDIIVRPDEAADPYAHFENGYEMFTAFQDNWNENYGGIVRDTAHFVTGNNTGVGGLGYLGAICNIEWAYGMTLGTSGTETTIRIITHELGHNWNAIHCLDPPCVVMCGACPVFGALTVGVMMDFRDSVDCLHAGGPHTTPIPPRAIAEEASTVKGQAIAIDVLANDHDANCDEVVIDAHDAYSQFGGTVELFAGNELLYTPQPGFGGRDTFSYTLGDGTGLQNSTVVSVDVYDADSGLATHYKLDEAGGSVAVDSSGGGHHGTYQGNARPNRPGAALGTGTSARFDGGTGHVIIPNDLRLSNLTSDFTVAAWVSPDDVSAVQRVFGNPNGWSFGLDNTGLVFSTIGIRDYTIAVGVPVDAWTHVAAVFSPDFNVTFYFNGDNIGTVNGSLASHSPGDNWFIATLHGDAEFFDGHIDDIQVYDRALDEGDVLFLFNHPGSVIGYDDPIPAVSEWGLVAMTLLVLTAGTVVLTRRRTART